jgi:hypothetical protein
MGALSCLVPGVVEAAGRGNRQPHVTSTPLAANGGLREDLTIDEAINTRRIQRPADVRGNAE